MVSSSAGSSRRSGNDVGGQGASAASVHVTLRHETLAFETVLPETVTFALPVTDMHSSRESEITMSAAQEQGAIST